MVETLDADPLVLAETPRSETGLAESLAAAGVAFDQIGDCVAPGGRASPSTTVAGSAWRWDQLARVGTGWGWRRGSSPAPRSGRRLA